MSIVTVHSFRSLTFKAELQNYEQCKNNEVLNKNEDNELTIPVRFTF